MSFKLNRGSDTPKCSKCLVSLIGRQYLFQERNKYCVGCYEELYCNSCHVCGETIVTDSRDISYKEFHFHEKCFCCTGCNKSLASESFIHKDGKFICAQCYENKFSPKCTTCGMAFKPGVKRMEYDGKSYHESCFCCVECDCTIGKKSFVKREGGIFCEGCFEAKVALKCGKCKKVIKNSGVSYRDDSFHANCFTCEGCDKNLAREQFVTLDESPYCLSCHIDKFAKKCLKCQTVISGVGESKMIAYENYNWHVSCFYCVSCNMTLEGEGFVLSEDEVYCPACSDDI